MPRSSLFYCTILMTSATLKTVYTLVQATFGFHLVFLTQVDSVKGDAVIGSFSPAAIVDERLLSSG